LPTRCGVELCRLHRRCRHVVRPGRGRVGSKSTRPVRPAKLAQPAAPSAEKFLETRASAASPSGCSVSTCGRHGCGSRCSVVADLLTAGILAIVVARHFAKGGVAVASVTVAVGVVAVATVAAVRLGRFATGTIAARRFGAAARTTGRPDRATLVRLLSSLHCRRAAEPSPLASGGIPS
jgi:hypothetical protein